jgi:putative hydrolase of the HAD superfamily
MVAPAPHLPTVILFDLDDTIVDYGSSTEPAWRQVCAAGAAVLPRGDAATLLAAVNRVRAWFWSDPERHRRGRADLRAASTAIVAQALRELGHDEPALAQQLAGSYRDLRDRSLRLLPGAVPTLERLRQHGTRLGLVTNGTQSDQRAKIERFALAPYFEHILIEGEFGCGKPDARVYRAALDALEAQPSDAWFVGDNIEWDVAAPQRLGMYAVWVDSGGRGIPSAASVRPDRIVGSIGDLLSGASQREGLGKS